MKNELKNQYPEMIDLPVGAPMPSSMNAPRRAAYERMRAAIAAVPSETLVPIRIDVDTAVATATSVLPAIRALRADIVAQLPRFDLSRFDQLEDRTLAMHYVNNSLREATSAAPDLPAMYARAVELRDTLVDAMRVLARYRILDAAVVENAGKAKGYRAVAGELQGLARVMREHAAEVAGKTPVTPPQLDRAEALAEEVFAGLDERAKRERESTSANLERQQAYTLFVSAYNDARRAILYLRDEAGDADTLAPSLYAGRGGRGNASEEEPEVPSEVEAPNADAEATSPVASAVPSASAGAAKAGAPKADSIFVPASSEPFVR